MIDHQSLIWQDIERHIKREIEQLRDSLEAIKDATQAAEVRGQIRFARALLAWPHQLPPPPTDANTDPYGDE